MAINTHITKEDCSQISDIRFHLKKLGKRRVTYTQSKKGERIIKIKVEIYEIKNRKIKNKQKAQ